MSLRKGDRRKCAQKHQNTREYRNDLHDASRRTKDINRTPVSGVCERCKAKIEWKIKYGKYKPLTAPRRCTVCHEKTVRFAYHTICTSCSSHAEVCGKCGEKGVVSYPGLSPTERAREEEQLSQALSHMREREKRAFLLLSDREKGQKSCKCGDTNDRDNATNCGSDNMLCDQQVDVELGDEESADLAVCSTVAVDEDSDLTEERETIEEGSAVCQRDNKHDSSGDIDDIQDGH